MCHVEGKEEPSHQAHLGSLSTETTSQLDVLALDGDTFGVDRTQIRVLLEEY